MDSRAIRERFDRPVLAAVIGITGIALLARVVFLGERIAHWDEARVAYDALRYLKTGIWHYDPSIHGPFLPQINRVVFDLIGPSDFSMRLIVAVVGGLLPLAAWLFRNHLRDESVVALALLFAADPVLLYYSRFMRNDVLVAAFAIAGFGLFVRYLDTRARRYILGGTLLLALAFTTKENAVLYPVTWLGGFSLVVGHWLLLALLGNEGAESTLRHQSRRVLHGLWRQRFDLLIAVVLFVTVIVVFYAPRQHGPVTFWEAIWNPALLPPMIEEATLGTVEKIRNLWIGGPFQDHGYLPYLGYLSLRMAAVSWPIVALAIAGYLSDVLRFGTPRTLVSMGFYAGVASIIGYPLAMSIPASWTATHVLVPLAFPAAAGIAEIYRWGMRATTRDASRPSRPMRDRRLRLPRWKRATSRDASRRHIAVVVALLLLPTYLAGAGFVTSFASPQSNILVQYTQPADDMRPGLTAAQNASLKSDGMDVLWYSERFLVENESDAYTLGVRDGHWYNRLPVPWYFEIANATIDSVGDLEDIGAEPPPVVVTCVDGLNCPDQRELGTLRSMLSTYTEFGPYRGRYDPEGEVFKYVFFVQDRYVATWQQSS